MNKKELLVNIFELKPKDNYGEEMSLQEFIECVNSGGFINYDGNGVLLYDNKEVDNSCTDCDSRKIKIGDMYYSMKLINKLFGEEVRVMWYNR